MTIDTILSQNFAPAVIILFMCLFLHNNSTLTRQSKHLFYVGLCLVILEMVSTDQEIYTATETGS